MTRSRGQPRTPVAASGKSCCRYGGRPAAEDVGSRRERSVTPTPALRACLRPAPARLEERRRRFQGRISRATSCSVLSLMSCPWIRPPLVTPNSTFRLARSDAERRLQAAFQVAGRFLELEGRHSPSATSLQRCEVHRLFLPRRLFFAAAPLRNGSPVEQVLRSWLPDLPESGRAAPCWSAGSCGTNRPSKACLRIACRSRAVLKVGFDLGFDSIDHG